MSAISHKRTLHCLCYSRFNGQWQGLPRTLFLVQHLNYYVKDNNFLVFENTDFS
jgi:hypothetical protein